MSAGAKLTEKRGKRRGETNNAFASFAMARKAGEGIMVALGEREVAFRKRNSPFKKVCGCIRFQSVPKVGLALVLKFSVSDGLIYFF